MGRFFVASMSIFNRCYKFGRDSRHLKMTLPILASPASGRLLNRKSWEEGVKGRLPKHYKVSRESLHSKVRKVKSAEQKDFQVSLVKCPTSVRCAEALQGRLGKAGE